MLDLPFLLRGSGHFFGVPAFGVVTTGDEWPEAPLAINQGGATFLAVFSSGDWRRPSSSTFFCGRDSFGILALGVVGTGQKFPEATGFDEHGGPTFFAGLLVSSTSSRLRAASHSL